VRLTLLIFSYFVRILQNIIHVDSTLNADIFNRSVKHFDS
jgi:hypothetical protein